MTKKYDKNNVIEFQHKWSYILIVYYIKVHYQYNLNKFNTRKPQFKSFILSSWVKFICSISMIVIIKTVFYFYFIALKAIQSRIRLFKLSYIYLEHIPLLPYISINTSTVCRSVSWLYPLKYLILTTSSRNIYNSLLPFLVKL